MRVARLMREVGLAGVSRCRGTRTTRVDASHRAAPDRAERQFQADAPDRIWVADITYAFAELKRVLRPGGIMLFTVPLHGGVRTIERARLLNGQVIHLQPPAHHCDPLLGGVGILAFRDYGSDIVERLLACGVHAGLD